MISPELLHRYQVFGNLDDKQHKKVSMIADDDIVKQGTSIFYAGDTANTLYILVEGEVDLLQIRGRILSKKYKGVFGW